MDLADIIRQQSALCEDIYIDVDTTLPCVAIGDDLFMQGDEAQAFIDEAEALYEKAQTVSMEECYACVAWPYIENME